MAQPTIRRLFLAPDHPGKLTRTRASVHHNSNSGALNLQCHTAPKTQTRQFYSAAKNSPDGHIMNGALPNVRIEIRLERRP
jgi:hypothetical protein